MGKQLHDSFIKDFRELLKKYDAEFSVEFHTERWSHKDVPTINFNYDERRGFIEPLELHSYIYGCINIESKYTLLKEPQEPQEYLTIELKSTPPNCLLSNPCPLRQAYYSQCEKIALYHHLIPLAL